MSTDRDADAWRDVGASLAAHAVDDARFELEEALYTVAEKLRAGEELAAEDVDAIRRAKDDLLVLTEERLAPLARDTEPWDRGAGMTIPHSVFRRHIEEDGYPETASRTTDE